MQNAIFKQIVFWVGIIIGISLVVAGMIYLVSLQQTPSSNGDLVIDNIITSEDWIKGSRDAKVTLIEYSDFQCPACAYFSPVLNQLSEEFGNDLALVYRHFPLPSHKNAKPMAMIAEAAGKQNKFWEMHEIIFTNQNKWSNSSDVTEIGLDYAKQIGLDVERFEKDLNSSELKKEINGIINANSKLGISYTPSFFLNGKLIPNPRSYGDFKEVIAQALNENE